MSDYRKEFQEINKRRENEINRNNETVNYSQLPENGNDLSKGKFYNFATKYLEYEKQKEKRKETKKQAKFSKQSVKTEKRKQKSEHTAKLLIESNLSEMTFQQKVVVLIRLFFFAGMPFFMYMIIPAVVIALGTFFVVRDVNLLNESYSSTMTNYYSFVGIACALLYLFRSAKKRGTKVSEDITFTLKGVNWKYISLMFVFGLSASILISSVYSLLPDWLMASYDSSTLDVYNTYDVTLLLISLTVLDPIAEEIVFRGYMLNRLLPVIKEKKSIWIVTLVFAVCHMSPFWIIYGIALGLILAKISIRHDNIVYSIAIHVGFNFQVLLNYIISNNSVLNKALFGNSLLFIIYGIISATVTVYLVWYYNKVENIGINFNFLKNK